MLFFNALPKPTSNYLDYHIIASIKLLGLHLHTLNFYETLLWNNNVGTCKQVASQYVCTTSIFTRKIAGKLIAIVVDYFAQDFPVLSC